MGTPVRHWGWLSIFSFVATVCSPILPRIRLLRNMNPDLGQGFLMRPPSLTPRGSLLQSLEWVGGMDHPTSAQHSMEGASACLQYFYFPGTMFLWDSGRFVSWKEVLEAKWWMGKAQGKNCWQVEISGTKDIQCLRKYSILEVLFFAFVWGLVPSLPSWMKRELTTC